MMHNTKSIPERIGSELVRDDPDFADLVVQFVAGLDERLAVMERALRQADFETLRAAAHQLKGSGGGYGYPIITEHASRLEQYATRHESDDCYSAVEVLRDICGRVVVDPNERT
jgi:HPt (histidine-containing phosphotransfer) domain-containing protein